MRTRTLIVRTLTIGALLATIVACKEIAGSSGPGPTEPTLLSVNSPSKDEDPFVLLARDGTIIVAWFSDRGANPDLYVSSTKNGRDWTPAARVTTSSAGDFYPNLYQDDQGLFHLTWFRWTALNVGQIMYNTSADGITWSTATEVPATNTPNVDDWVPTITGTADGTVLIYFVSKVRNTNNQQDDIYLAAKRPGVATFDAAVPLTVNSATMHDHLPFAARTGTGVDLVWERHDLTQETPWLNPKSDLFHATSLDGKTWSAPVKITNDAGNVVHLFPALYADQQHQWSVLWLSTRSGAPKALELSLNQLAGYPQTATVNSSLPEGYSHRIAPTTVPGLYIAAWVQGPEGAQDIYYRFFKR